MLIKIMVIQLVIIYNLKAWETHKEIIKSKSYNNISESMNQHLMINELSGIISTLAHKENCSKQVLRGRNFVTILLKLQIMPPHKRADKVDHNLLDLLLLARVLQFQVLNQNSCSTDYNNTWLIQNIYNFYRKKRDHI